MKKLHALHSLQTVVARPAEAVAVVVSTEEILNLGRPVVGATWPYACFTRRFTPHPLSSTPATHAAVSLRAAPPPPVVFGAPFLGRTLRAAH